MYFTQFHKSHKFYNQKVAAIKFGFTVVDRILLKYRAARRLNKSNHFVSLADYERRSIWLIIANDKGQRQRSSPRIVSTMNWPRHALLCCFHSPKQYHKNHWMLKQKRWHQKLNILKFGSNWWCFLTNIKICLFNCHNIKVLIMMLLGKHYFGIKSNITWYHLDITC